MKRLVSAWPALAMAILWLLPLGFLFVAAFDGSRGDGSGRGLWWWVEQRAWRIAARHTEHGAGRRVHDLADTGLHALGQQQRGARLTWMGLGAHQK